jgi:hypothetical protein
VSVALFIQHAMGMRHIAICDLSGSTKLLHILKRHDFLGAGAELLNINVCFDFSYKFLL